MDRFVACCGNNHLILNVNKAKGMIMDFGRTSNKSNNISIMGEEVEVVEEYKYLGVHLDNRLDWRCNTYAVYKKGQNRLYFLKKLQSFSVCNKMLHIFYKSVIESAILSAAIRWGSSIRDSDLKLNKPIKKAGSVLGTVVKPLELIVQRRILHKMNIMDNSEHPLHNTMIQQQSD